MAIELYEKGVLKREATDALELVWGNTAAIKILLERIAHRQTLTMHAPLPQWHEPGRCHHLFFVR